MTASLLRDPTPAFRAHITRICRENEAERWSPANVGEQFDVAYSPERMAAPLDAPPWSRVWAAERLGRVVGHASLLGTGEPDGVVYGHISVERDYRGLGVMRELQSARLGFADEFGLTLVGPCAAHNARSYRMCVGYGFSELRRDDDADPPVIWLFRLPRMHHG